MTYAETLTHQARERLLRRRQSLMHLHQSLRSEATEWTGELSHGEVRDARPVSESLAVALSERERTELAEIEAALERLESGHYGDCQNCGKPIGRGRLRAVPEARLCLSCTSAAEHA